jgi:ADP-dependent NAD(P)H-hydrate dehydratase / NAD(P)H-hydrate epimerase
MKILPVDKIREADEFTILREPISDIDLMERAAAVCHQWLLRNVASKRKFSLFCGNGNNGGDGLAIARMLLLDGFQVDVYLTASPDRLSNSCRMNLERLLAINRDEVIYLLPENAGSFILEEDEIVIDALFGSGLTRPVEGFLAGIIWQINSSPSITVSIDVPSGMFCDQSHSGTEKPAIIRADYTLTFSPPKLAFFFPENDTYTGEWHLLDIGIHKEYTDQAETRNYLTGSEDCKKILKKRNKFSHKGIFGHALLFCGSYGKMGAAVLSARACLRSGAGLVTVHVPGSGNAILQTAVPEAMLNMDGNEKFFSEVPQLAPFSAIAAGPGLGMEKETQRALKLLIQNTMIPLILDADAINILGENPTWISFLPKGSILTPHIKEFERLAGRSSNDFERNSKQRDFSLKHGIYLILKGRYTAITTPDGICYFNPTGNPGMATGGSGDVLTGILAGIKAQGYSSLETCILGVYLHGLAGDLASGKFGVEALIASDIIDNLGKAFKSLYG